MTAIAQGTRRGKPVACVVWRAAATLAALATAGATVAVTMPAADAATPTVRHFNPTVDLAIDYRADWTDAPDAGPYVNPYRVGWEDFLRHLVTGTAIRADFNAGIRDLEFAEACYRSAGERTWIDFTPPDPRPPHRAPEIRPA